MTPTPTPPPTPPGALSPDGHYRWDGTTWQAVQAVSAGADAPAAQTSPGTPQPTSQGTLSPDGQYRWDGTAWQAVQGAPPAPVVQKKGHLARNLGLGCIGLIVLIVIIALATSASKNTHTNTTSKSASPSPSLRSTPSAAETGMTAQQKAGLQKIMTDEMNHYDALFTGGKTALGTEKYPDANAGLAAFNDPNSGASMFSRWRGSSKAEQDVSYIDTFRQVEASYTTNHRPPTVDTWRDDQTAMGDALNAWVSVAVSWQISGKSDAELASAEATFHAASTKTQTDIAKIVVES